MKNTSRRKFLKLIGAGTCGTLAHRVLTPYNGLVAYAQSVPSLGANYPVLIVINLAGGCSYNITPIYHGAWRDKNPNISFGPEAIAQQNGTTVGSHVLTNEQGLHPMLTGLKQVYNEGNLALLNSVGYPKPERSHDKSTQIWFKGVRNSSGGGGVAGWGARLTSQLASAYAGFSLAGTNLLINGGINPPHSLGSLQNLSENNLPYGTGQKWFNITRDTLALTLANQYPGARKQYISNAIDNAEKTAGILKAELNQQNATGVTFSTSNFGSECSKAAQLIKAKSIGVQFIYMELGGFDTHSDERSRQIDLFRTLNEGLTPLITYLKHPTVDRWKDTTIITMSEFSRTFENGSRGTDHGHAAPMLFMGGAVKGGIKNSPPSAQYVQSAPSFLENYEIDFREPFYAAVKHMGLNADLVFPEAFNTKNLDLFL